MELRDVLQQMIQENTRAGQPTDLRIGTVTKADPLEITINTQMAPLRAGVLLLTECVVEPDYLSGVRTGPAGGKRLYHPEPRVSGGG